MASDGMAAQLISQAEAGDPEAQRAPSTVKWCELNFKVKDKEILRDVSGGLEVGKLACILGPSGAGKSTLLNVLAGRQRTSGQGMSMTGTIEVAGKLVTAQQMKKYTAFVMQDDALMATQTVRESLMFSAALKLAGQPAQELAASVDNLIGQLGLEHCKDTRIGSALVKGVSGGERKRSSVGVELITNPKIIFLDEPTSGLDSYAASELVKQLAALAKRGCIVACTIHQPSSEVFELFEQVFCLRRGEMMFQGANSALWGIMNDVGMPCPKGYNVADWLLMIAQTKTDEECGRLITLSSEKSGAADFQRKQSGQSQNLQAVGLIEVPRAGFGKQIGMLTKREFQNVFRDKASFGARMGMTFGQAILYALIYPGVASQKTIDSCGVDVACIASKNFNVFGALVGMCIAGFFGSAQPLLLSFPHERPVFLREYSSNMYSVVAYFIAKTLVELFVILLQVTSLFVITWFVFQFDTGIAGLLESIFAVWLMAISAGSMALLIGCSVSTPQAAIQLAPAISVPQILFSGLFLQAKDLPVYLRWVQYICALKYGINLLCITEFASTDSRTRPLGDAFLEQQDIEPDWRLLYIGILLAIFFGFRILALIVLRNKGKYVF